MSARHLLGLTLLDIVATVDGRTVVSCPLCGAVALFEADEELQHVHQSIDCPVSRLAVAVQRDFIEMSGSRSPRGPS